MNVVNKKFLHDKGYVRKLGLNWYSRICDFDCEYAVCLKILMNTQPNLQIWRNVYGYRQNACRVIFDSHRFFK